MERKAPTEHGIHDLLAHRWSPRAFAGTPVSKEDLLSLFEAARWAPSCFNEQPWRFLVARKEDGDAYEKMLGCLMEGNASWASAAPVLMITMAESTFARNGNANRHAGHDLGLAVAQMTVEAQSRGLAMHQMGGILVDKIREAYAVPESVEILAGIALGHPGNPDSLPEGLKERELAPRSRNPMADMVFSGSFGESWD